MLNGDGLTGFGDVEHVQYHLFVSSVLATVDSAHHFNDGFALMERAFVAVFANNRQFALFHDAVIYHVVVIFNNLCRYVGMAWLFSFSGFDKCNQGNYHPRYGYR